jgi:hypothetical protein
MPAGEFFHPAPLVAVLLLLVNDHVLKGSGVIPTTVTGKLSDVCGLLFFPLLVTACADTAGLAAARAGAPLDFSLRRWKLAAAIGSTGLGFATIKLWPAAADLTVRALRWLGLNAAIIPDRSDLVALPALAAAWWVGWREIARVPLGRLEVIERAHHRGGPSPAALLADVAACGGDPRKVGRLADALERYLDGGPDDPVRATLSELRDVGP